MDDVFREGGNNIMNKVCLYYGIICGVFLTSTAAPAADFTVGAIGGGDYAAAYCLKQPGGKYFLPGVAQLQLLAPAKKKLTRRWPNCGLQQVTGGFTGLPTKTAQPTRWPWLWMTEAFTEVIKRHFSGHGVLSTTENRSEIAEEILRDICPSE